MPLALWSLLKKPRTRRSRFVFCPSRDLALLTLLSLPFVSGASAQGPSHAGNPVAQTSPSWLDQAVFYEIFPRDFSPAGNLPGVTAQMDRLQQLGVNVLWLMPIHPTGKSHRMGSYGSLYAVSDYYAIEPELGTKADLLHLVQEAHTRHMRVILDEVPDHTAWDSVMMSHPEFYQRDAAGKIQYPHSWTDVAALAYSDPGLRKYMIEMYTYWLKTFDLDGFRCDDAGDVPVAFWEEASSALRAVRPDVLLLAEASQPELLRKDFNVDYAWPLLDAMNQVIMHGRPASAIREVVQAQEGRFPSGSRHMLISDDHDTRRAMVRYSAQGALAASALVFTLPGVPMLYNGMEVGDATPSAGPALFEKVPIVWRSGATEPAIADFYKKMIPLRAASPALQHGELVWLRNSEEEHIVTFLRRSPEETVLVAVNLANRPFVGSVEAGPGAWNEVVLSGSAKHGEAGMPTAEASATPPPLALPILSLPPFGVRVFRTSRAISTP